MESPPLAPEHCCPTCGQAIRNVSFFVDMENNIVICGDRAAHITRQQAELLHLLRKSYPNPVRQDRLISGLWGGQEPDMAIDTIRTVINRVRKLLAPFNWGIENNYQGGYRLRRR